jgi:hypothetical protein
VLLDRNDQRQLVALNDLRLLRTSLSQLGSVTPWANEHAMAVLPATADQVRTLVHLATIQEDGSCALEALLAAGAHVGMTPDGGFVGGIGFSAFSFDPRTQSWHDIDRGTDHLSLAALLGAMGRTPLARSRILLTLPETASGRARFLRPCLRDLSTLRHSPPVVPDKWPSYGVTPVQIVTLRQVLHRSAGSCAYEALCASDDHLVISPSGEPLRLASPLHHPDADLLEMDQHPHQIEILPDGTPQSVIRCNGHTIPVALLDAAQCFPTFALWEIWLEEPCPALDHQIPRLVLDHPGGLARVEAALRNQSQSPGA